MRYLIEALDPSTYTVLDMRNNQGYLLMASPVKNGVFNTYLSMASISGTPSDSFAEFSTETYGAYVYAIDQINVSSLLHFMIRTLEYGDDAANPKMLAFYLGGHVNGAFLKYPTIPAMH